MVAFEITCASTNWKRVVVGESSKGCPLYERDEWLKDRGASFGLDANGKLVAYQWGQVLDATELYTISRASLPEWVKEHKHTESQEATEMAKPFTKEQQVGKKSKKAEVKAKVKAKTGSNGAVPKTEKPKAAPKPVAKTGGWTLVEKKAGKESVIHRGARASCYMAAKRQGVDKPTSKEFRKGTDAEYILRPAK